MEQNEPMATGHTSRLLKQKWFLYATEFFSGMSVMAIELGASRLLAPYFSSSQIVWTIIIGAIMIAMAIGNVVGGRSADKNASADRLYLRLLIVAVWIAAVPFFGKYIIAAISLILAVLSGENFLIFASFFSCAVLFVFPLLLLGTVSPTLAKLSVRSLDESGKTVGELGALNTIGSIIGTFLPTFFTIPTVGTALTFVIFAAILLVISLIYFIFEYVKISPKKIVKPCIALLLTVGFSVLASFSTFAFWETEDENFYEDESIYNYLQVTETAKYTALSTNVLFGVQSIAPKNGYLTGLYYDYALAAPFLAGLTAKSEGDMLILGFGTGTYAGQCLHYFPNMKITGVEIDEKILELSFDRFGLSRDEERLQTVVFDGRAYLRMSKDTYDVIMVDAYRDITIPPQMSSVEFFTEVKDRLRDGGVMVVNLNMVSEDTGSINEYLEDTIASVFPTVYIVDCNGNRELFAVKGDDPLPALTKNAEGSPNELQKVINSVKIGMKKYEGGSYILTDDKAPVELLGMKVIDKMIEEQISYYRDLLRGKSIKEMIEIVTE